MKKNKVSYEVYFDFDNTITSFDVLDDIIERFSINKDWIELEDLWKKGKISSHKCLKGQMAGLRVTRKVLKKYLSEIKIDPYFIRILRLLRKRNIEPVIISDDFRFIVKTILDNNGIQGVKLTTNELRFKGDKLLVSFPHHHSLCPKCGNCKTAHLINRKRKSAVRKVYVGDGLSDVCPAEFCEIVFAKGSLLKHFRSIKQKCLPFKDLSTIYKYFFRRRTER